MYLELAFLPLVTWVIYWFCFRSRAERMQGLSGPQRLLFEAAKQGDLASLQALLDEQDLDANSKTYVRTTQGGMTALFFAAEQGNPLVLRSLLQHGSSVNHIANVLPTQNGDTALRRAVHRNHVRAAEELLAWQASVNEVYGDKMSPLLVAVNRDSVDMVRTLLRKGADWRVFVRPAARKMLENAMEEMQWLVGRYEAWEDTKNLLFIYTCSRGRRPNLPTDLLRLTAGYLSPIDHY